MVTGSYFCLPSSGPHHSQRLWVWRVELKTSPGCWMSLFMLVHTHPPTHPTFLLWIPTFTSLSLRVSLPCCGSQPVLLWLSFRSREQTCAPKEHWKSRKHSSSMSIHYFLPRWRFGWKRVPKLLPWQLWRISLWLWQPMMHIRYGGRIFI